MAELPLSVNDYEKAVFLTALVTRIKEDIIALPTVTDAVFKPVIKGYEVTFKENGNYYKLELKVSKHVFLKHKISVSVFEDGNSIKKFKTFDADEAVKEIKSVFIC